MSSQELTLTSNDSISHTHMTKRCRSEGKVVKCLVQQAQQASISIVESTTKVFSGLRIFREGGGGGEVVALAAAGPS